MILKEDLEVYGIDSEIRILKNDGISFSFRIGAKGPLFTKEIERSFVRIEISKRESVIKKPDVIEFDALYTDILPFFVLVMGREEILAEKVRAVLTRNRARAVYDLWFLLKKGTRFELNLITEKLKYYKKVFECEKFTERIEEKGWYWESELKPLVIGRLPVMFYCRGFFKPPCSMSISSPGNAFETILSTVKACLNWQPCGKRKFCLVTGKKLRVLTVVSAFISVSC